MKVNGFKCRYFCYLSLSSKSLSCPLTNNILHYQLIINYSENAKKKVSYTKMYSQ